MLDVITPQCSNFSGGLTHCGLLTPYGDIDLGQHWPDGTKPSPEPVLTYHQLTFINKLHHFGGDSNEKSYRMSGRSYPIEESIDIHLRAILQKIPQPPII